MQTQASMQGKRGTPPFGKKWSPEKGVKGENVRGRAEKWQKEFVKGKGGALVGDKMGSQRS